MDAVSDLPPYTILENGYIHGTWFCGRPVKKYYGAFPQGFWPRAKQVLRPWGSMVHWFSGTMPPEPGIVTVDGNPETNPSVVSLGAVLPFEDCTFDAAFADPPYSPGDSKRYGLPYISANKILAELARVTRPGGKIGLLHEFIPKSKGLPVKLLGIVGIMNGPQKRIRLFAIYQKSEAGLDLTPRLPDADQGGARG